MSEPFVCRFCPQGNPSGLPRSALGSDCCTGAACKRARAHERAQRAAGVQVATPTQAETTLCFKVKEVIGVSLCMEQMSAAERRVGRERADEEIRCQVRGKFGSDADEDNDDMLPDTRWVKLSELTDNIREADLKALDEFTRGLNKGIKDAKARSWRRTVA